MGEIGKAVAKVVGADYTIDVEPVKVDEKIDVLHICFPYSGTFCSDVLEYVDKYDPKETIIYSTLPIGTCDKLFDTIVHSPVEGKHPDLELSIYTMERWIASHSKESLQFFAGFFKDKGIRTRKVKNPMFTEALKLLSTSEYGINIVFAAYKEEVAAEIGMDYELVKDWNIEYNRLYRELGYGKEYQKYVLEAPEGPIGGHCVVPNAKLLDKAYPNEMLKIIQRMGK